MCNAIVNHHNTLLACFNCSHLDVKLVKEVHLIMLWLVFDTYPARKLFSNKMLSFCISDIFHFSLFILWADLEI